MKKHRYILLTAAVILVVAFLIVFTGCNNATEAAGELTAETTGQDDAEDPEVEEMDIIDEEDDDMTGVEEAQKADQPAAEGEASGEEVADEPAEETEEMTDGQTAAGSCYNPYFPVVEDKVWNYSVDSPDMESLDYSMSYKDIDDSSFTQVITFPDGTIESDYACNDAGIVESDYRELVFTESIIGAEYETLSAEGITFPPEDELVVGKTWSMVYELEGELVGGDIEAIANVTIEMDFEVVAIEDIEIPLDTYSDALKVVNDTRITISTDFFDNDFDSQSDSWYVKEVGLVKNESILDGSVTTTLLTSIE